MATYLTTHDSFDSFDSFDGTMRSLGSGRQGQCGGSH
jgi:hypothetical protein